MRTHAFLFSLLLAMCFVVGGTLLIPEKENSHGVAHTRFVAATALQEGGPGQQRHGHLRVLGAVFGMLQAVFITTALTLGVLDRRRRFWPFLIGGCIFAILFAMIVYTDGAYARGESRQLVLSFPLPTALMLYGVASVPLLFMILYVVKFDSWILTDEDLQRFHQLVRQKKDKA